MEILYPNRLQHEKRQYSALIKTFISSSYLKISFIHVSDLCEPQTICFSLESIYKN
ncbi:hypothetical protein MUS_0820 [Bacillus velezensis YAU B9601-Y2]|uniref:Uncharacterized protein n=1 Tax=Bacillus amyloliquefaciens (strain Y2) TaxID=1155777 RepID=I2C2J6_BACAY|nr:hypothetical protein MUS_0820 [Bacillus velezensis YAU B9601-Y2]